MMLISMTEQAALLITICFSLLIFCFTQILNKEKKPLKIIGLSFFVPLFLCLFALFYPAIIAPAKLLLYIDFSLLGIIFLVALLWRITQKYNICVMLIFIFPIAIILASRYGKALPDLFLSDYAQTIIAVVLALAAILIFNKYAEHKDSRFIGGLLLLATGQIILLFMFQELAFIGVGVKFLAYLLLSYYVINMTQVSYTKRLIAAESKLANLDKTINLEVKKKMIPIKQHNEHLQNMVMIDNLTNAYNKKYILSTMEKMITAPKKTEVFSIIMFDIDNFKSLNDTQGHLAGDIILKKVANIAKTTIRLLDALGRYGGDEFIIILPGINASEGMFVAHRFRKGVEAADLDISVSIGVSSYPKDAKTVEGLIEIADAGLYHSKKLGKNTVTHYPQIIQDKGQKNRPLVP